MDEGQAVVLAKGSITAYLSKCKDETASVDDLMAEIKRAIPRYFSDREILTKAISSLWDEEKIIYLSKMGEISKDELFYSEVKLNDEV